MARTTLPPHHLALVIEDALAALAGVTDAGSAAAPQPDRRAALLYGWASGVVSARELAARVETDPGLSYLLGGRLWSFQEIRAFRDEERASLEALYANVLRLCRLAGMTRLGAISLDEPAGAAATGADRPVPAAYARLATALFSRASAADEREDRELGAGGRTIGLPAELTERSRRQAALRDASARMGVGTPLSQESAPFPGPGAADRPPASPAHRRFRIEPYVRVIAVVAILLAGLLLVRWVAWATAMPAGGTSPSRARAGLMAPSVPPAAGLTATTPADEAPEELDVVAARDEAMRLAGDALLGDRLQAARDLYFLALQAVPRDQEATRRLRQVETALRIDERRDGWEEARSELEQLRAAAPGSAAVLRAYVTALVGAGREALAGRETPRALAFCEEAIRWLPARPDAQACLAQAQLAAAPTPTSGPATAGSPTPPGAPTRPTSVAVSAPSTPGTGDLPQQTMDEIMPILERLQDQLSRFGPPLPLGTPTPVDGAP